jgi:hypothetical protein
MNIDSGVNFGEFIKKLLEVCTSNKLLGNKLVRGLKFDAATFEQGGMKKIKGACPKLEKLQINGNLSNITKKDWEDTPSGLKSLCLDAFSKNYIRGSNKISDASWKVLGAMLTKLKSLGLSYFDNDISKVLYNFTVNLTAIKIVFLPTWKVKKLDVLERFKHLKCFSCSFTELPDGWWKNVNSGLEKLYLTRLGSNLETQKKIFERFSELKVLRTEYPQRLALAFLPMGLMELSVRLFEQDPDPLSVIGERCKKLRVLTLDQVFLNSKNLKSSNFNDLPKGLEKIIFDVDLTVMLMDKFLKKLKKEFKGLSRLREIKIGDLTFKKTHGKKAFDWKAINKAVGEKYVKKKFQKRFLFF